MNKKFDKNKDRMKGKDGFKPKFNSDKKSFRDSMQPPKEVKISDINIKNKGQAFSVSGSVDRVVQTGGPTIFYVSDGTATLALKAFDGAGVRSYPEIEVGSVIKSEITIEEFNGELEGEVQRIFELKGEEKERFLENLKEVEKERARVEVIPFMVDNNILHKLKDRFVEAATQIRLAIIQNRPVIVRHHNDTDGYSSGFALERAILPLISKQHNSVKAAWEFYTRAPCAAPMYEIDDSIRDTSHSLSAAAKFSNKMPLVIIADTGSGKEDLLGIKHGKVHGQDFIVIDHHRFEEDLISKEVLVHIKPFLVGEDGSAYSAGMLCAELARSINSDISESIKMIPALAGMADKTNNPEVMAEYVKQAEQMEYNKSMLEDIGEVIDFVSAKLRFMEAREYIEVLFGEPIEKQRALVELLGPYIKEQSEKGLKIAKSSVKVEHIGGVNVQFLDIENSYNRGFYPKPGKCTSMIHDFLAQKEKKVVTLGHMTDAVTMRATDEAEFSVQEIIAYLNRHITGAFVEGGGHRNAGSIRFVPSKKSEVMEKIREYMKKK